MAKGKKKGGKGPKDPFALVGPELRDAIAQSTPEEIKSRMANLVLLGMAQAEMKAADDKLQAAKLEFDNLNDPYKQDALALKQTLAFCKQVLGDKGKDNTGTGAMRPAPDHQTAAERAASEFVDSVKKNLQPGESIAFVTPGGKSAVIGA